MTTTNKISSKVAAGAKRTPSSRVTARASKRHAARAAASPASPKQRSQWAGLSVKQLQAMYLEVVGRETGSRDAAYLVWKVREAKAGRVPVGPRTVHAAADMTTLPFRVPIAASEAMDEVWRARGTRSRNRFLEEAVERHLAALGETKAAKLFESSRGGAP